MTDRTEIYKDTYYVISFPTDGWLPLAANLAIIGVSLTLLLIGMTYPDHLRSIKNRIIRAGKWIDYNSERWILVLAIIGALLYFFVFLTTGTRLLSSLQTAISGYESGTENTSSTAIRDLSLALAAFFGLPFVVWRVLLSQKQTNLSEQGLYTDRFTKAVEQLGKDKDGGVPNIEVRLGALFALERIAQDSERDHIPIMETICAYVRENTKDDKYSKDYPYTPREDIQTALTILARRTQSRCNHERSTDTGKHAYALDLRLCHIAGADLSNANFEHVQLQNTELTEAILDRANLTQAMLFKTNLTGASLYRTVLEDAKLQQTKFINADLLEANLIVEYLANCDFKDCFVYGVAVYGRIGRNQNLTQYQIDEMFGCANTNLHRDFQKPEKWKTRIGDLAYFKKSWKAYHNFT